MADLANSQANLKSRAGLSRQLQVDRTDLPPDPSRGGQRGFPLWFRQQAITMYHTHGEDGIQNLGCSMRSVRRWLLRDAPYRMTGGKQREALTGVDQLLLCTFIFIYPNASADACSTYSPFAIRDIMGSCRSFLEAIPQANVTPTTSTLIEISRSHCLCIAMH